jgi:hypothetical protein
VYLLTPIKTAREISGTNWRSAPLSWIPYGDRASGNSRELAKPDILQNALSEDSTNGPCSNYQIDGLPPVRDRDIA